MWYYYAALALFIVSLFASFLVKSRFNKYVTYSVASNYNGAITANTILRSRNISDVKVVSVPGNLTDNYNPTNKTLSLSEEVYNELEGEVKSRFMPQKPVRVKGIHLPVLLFVFNEDQTKRTLFENHTSAWM